MSDDRRHRVSLTGAVAIGIGGMVGGGIFAVLTRSEVLSACYALAGALLFCLFIVYDTYRITTMLGRLCCESRNCCSLMMTMSTNYAIIAH